MATEGSVRTRRRRGAPFEESVVQQGDCLIWMAALDKGGYGKFLHNGRTRQAHHVAWEAVFGPIPIGYELHHTCHVRACVNVAHLNCVTKQEHRLLDYADMTHCKRGHPYTEDNIYLLPKRYPGGGYRSCRRCRADREAERRERQHVSQ